ncbi:SDR family NAD(P)-dependent oxidoreductase [Nocardia arizonensis]|uniref:SDR family NAD(P)-dependent oxidoreductase n=1 Tax=Nocardia arizonensis TaxID=1141647 RepID=UPI0006D18E02|nr:SDR family NAD(P)-dependent oxidoreductase [Nocardia arizonensis]
MLEFRAAPGRLTDRLRRRDPAATCPAGLCVLVTEACSDIGRATATRLAGRGMRLVLVDRHADRLAEVRERITASGGLARERRCDLSALGDIDQLVEWVRGEFGAVDVLVNNADATLRAVAPSPDRFRDYQRSMAANYFGPLRLTLGLVPALRLARSGLVVNVGPRPLAETCFAGATAAWSTFGHCADAELAQQGIRVCAVDTAPASNERATIAAHGVETAIRERHRPSASRRSRAPRGPGGISPHGG